jgi:hypothetical protein
MLDPWSSNEVLRSMVRADAIQGSTEASQKWVAPNKRGGPKSAPLGNIQLAFLA